MKIRVRLALMTTAGTVLILYYIALKIAEPGRIYFDFSAIWIISGLALWIKAVMPRRRKKAMNQDTQATLKRRSIARAAFAVAKIGLLGGILVSLGILAYIISPVPFKEKNSEVSEYLIVLGGGILESGKPSYTLKARLDTAVAHIAQNPEVTVIVTGGQGKREPFPEADAMADYILQRSNIDKTRVIRESASLDTIQNIANCKAIIEKAEGQNPRPLIHILTSGFHLRRSLLLARMAGLPDAAGLASPCPALFIPANYLREIGAYWKLGLRKILTGKVFAL